MKVLVVGGGGQLGSKVVSVQERDGSHDVKGADLPSFDVTRETQVHEVVESFRPDWIVNCAAFTDVERAESEPEAAYRVNEVAVGYLADAALRSGARLLHISTDYVFSGRGAGPARRPYVEDDPPGPINVYGASKLAGEALLLRHEASSLIARTSWLYGGPGKNFLDTVLRLAQERRSTGQALRIVDDQVGTPTDSWSLARQLAVLLETDVRGRVHASCGGEASWFEFAQAIVRHAGGAVPVEAVSSDAYPTRARRPPYSVLENRRLRELSLDVMPTWQEGLERALHARA